MYRLREALRAIRVLDLSRYLPGPLATVLMGDLGAEVLKIEAPGGDEMRELGPRDAQGHPVYHRALNAGKAVLRIDLKSPAGQAQFLDLVRTADVLVESFRPGVMERLGIGYARLAQLNPRLVHCALSGYGANHSPLVAAAGHDANYLALSGALHRNPGGGPFDPPVADTSGSLFAVIAILGALRARDRDGRGCSIDIALADVAAPLQAFQIADWGANGADPGPQATVLNGGAAYYRVYATGDGRHVALGAIEPKFWLAFCEAAGRPDWFGRGRNDPLPQQALTAEVGAWFAQRTQQACMALLDGVDCCATPVLNLSEAMRCAHVRQRGLVRRDGGGELQALFPARVDGEAPPLRAPLREVDDAGNGPGAPAL